MTSPRTSRGGLGLGIGVLCGWASAAVFAFALAHANTGLLLFAYLAAVPLFLAAFTAGIPGSLTAALLGTGGLALSVGPQIAFLFTLVNVLPVTVLSVLSMRYKVSESGKIFWYPEGLLVTILALLPCLAFLGAVAMAASHEGGLLGVTTTMIQNAVDQVSKEMEPEVAVGFKTLIPMMAKVMPGLLGLCWSFLVLASAFIAQNMIRKEGWSLRDPFSWADFTIPTTVLIGVALTGLAAVFAPLEIAYVALNLCMMLCLPLFFSGLALVHLFAASRKYKTLFLVLFYLLLCLVPWLVVLIALLGALDQAFGLKGRLTQGPTQV